ncbi:hypothetical protein [uncultured Enterococcus sp.]|uniref:hypothetical protein n=1 Tax=uncultured Enterococcus sp. TaxID=167972 RepID=UPI002AA649CB|nr:hypothetical protein [uncultured Enterococcus sp.]
MKKLSAELNKEIRWQKYLQIFCQLLIEAYEANLSESEEVDSKKIVERFRVMSRPIVSYLYSVENWSVFEVLLFRLFSVYFSGGNNSSAVTYCRFENRKGAWFAFDEGDEGKFNLFSLSIIFEFSML